MLAGHIQSQTSHSPFSPKILPTPNLTGDSSTPMSSHTGTGTPEAGRRVRNEGLIPHYLCVNNTTGLIKNATAHGYVYANHVSRK